MHTPFGMKCRSLLMGAATAANLAPAQNSTPPYPKIDNTVGYKKVDTNWPAVAVVAIHL